MPILENKIPVLDKGFVAMFDSSSNSRKLNEIAVEYFKKLDGKFLTDISSLTLLIKCPLFVQLNLSTFGFKVTNLPIQQIETYIPNVGEIGAPTLSASTDIAENIERTSHALMMNPKAYCADGCDRFMSQILTPINTYTTILVHGMYNDWCKFIAQPKPPNPIRSYMEAVAEILKAEWQ